MSNMQTNLKGGSFNNYFYFYMIYIIINIYNLIFKNYQF